MDNNDAKVEERSSTIKPATALSKQFVRYLVGFGVGVGIGLAPYLGILNVRCSNLYFR